MILRYGLKETYFKKTERFLRKTYGWCSRQVRYREDSSLLFVAVILGRISLFSYGGLHTLGIKSMRLREYDRNGDNQAEDHGDIFIFFSHFKRGNKNRIDTRGVKEFSYYLQWGS